MKAVVRLAALAAGACVWESKALESTFTPYISLRPIYTDNVFLDSDNEVSDTVLDSNLGFAYLLDGNRIDIEMNLNLQNVNYDDHSEFNENFQQVSLINSNELIRNWFFLELTGEIGQEALSTASPFSIDNINITDNRTEFVQYSARPSIAHNFANDWEFEAAVRFLDIDYESVDATIPVGFTDTQLLEEIFSANSGPNATNLDWNLNHNQRTFERDDAGQTESEFLDQRAEFDWGFSEDWGLLVVGGNEENFTNGNEVGINGTYHSAGFSYQPSSAWSISAVHGEDNKEASLLINPNERVRFQVDYIDRRVGVILDERLEVDLNWQMRHLTWTASYSEVIGSDALNFGQDGTGPQFPQYR